MMIIVDDSFFAIVEGKIRGNGIRGWWSAMAAALASTTASSDRPEARWRLVRLFRRA
jgi:hypothetical protein